MTPDNDFETSLRFYKTLGFEAYVYDPCGVLWHFAQDTRWDA